MHFFFHFLKNPKKVASITPSSQFLTRAIVDAAELSSKKSIVVLGSGTGVLLRPILNNMPDQSLFFAMEINKKFVDISRKKVPEAIVYHAPAQELKKYLMNHDRETCDCIISALPWSTLDTAVQEEILTDISSPLAEGGFFLTIANIQGLLMPSGKQFKKLLQQHFKTVKRTKIIWRNIMPSIIYVCEK